MSKKTNRFTEAVYSWLLWATNNDSAARLEREFDIAFFIVNTLALLLGSGFLVYIQEYAWIAFLVIEYIWAWDNMRHNRE